MKKLTAIITLVFCFSFVFAMQLQADDSCFPTCCTYEFTYNGFTCWTGGQMVNGTCVMAEQWLACRMGEEWIIIQNPCYTGTVDCDGIQFVD